MNAPARSRGGQRLPDDERLVELRTRVLPRSEAYLRRLAAETGTSYAQVARELLEQAIEARGADRCRSCGADIAGMIAYRVGEPRELCDACEEGEPPTRIAPPHR